MLEPMLCFRPHVARQSSLVPEISANQTNTQPTARNRGVRSP